MLKNCSLSFLFIFLSLNLFAQTNVNDDVTLESFRAMTEKFKLIMSPDVQKIRKNLVLDLRVNDGGDRYMVKAEADVQGRNAIVRLYGGMARHELINLDGLTLILCHELGHHLAGPPIRRFDQPWSSAEGQADYWATQYCAKKMWQEESWEIPVTTHPNVLKACQATSSLKLCVRLMNASLVMTNVLKSMRRMQRAINFDEIPSTHSVGQTVTDHPGIACRFKTLIGGSLCPIDEKCPRMSEELMSSGKPACWFKPD